MYTEDVNEIKSIYKKKDKKIKIKHVENVNRNSLTP